MALFYKCFSLKIIMGRILGEFQSGNDLLININWDQDIQESFSRFTGSPRIVVTGIRTGEPGWIDSSTGNSLTPVVEQFHEPVEKPGECRESDRPIEFLVRCEMEYFVELDSLPKEVHDLSEFYCLPVVFRQLLFEKKEDE